MATPVNIQEAAKLFSCSVRGIREWVNKGMPCTKEMKKKTGKVGPPRLQFDPEACRNWLIENNVRTFMKSEIRHSMESGAAQVSSPAATIPAVPVAAPTLPAQSQAPVAQAAAKESSAVNVKPGVDGAVDRLRAIELRAFSDYVRARNAGDTMGMRAHMKLHSEAVRRMLEAEGVIDSHKGVEAEVWGRMSVAMTAWADAIKALVEQMPRAMASRCNVSEPAMAEKALRDWIDSQLYPMLGRDPKT